MTPPTANSRINVQSLLTGIALGAVLASFGWIQVLPDSAADRSGGEGEFLFVGPGDAPVTDDVASAAGPQSRVIQRSGGGASDDENAEAGGVDVQGGGSGGGSVGGGGSGSGVASDRVKFGATVAEDGIAKAFLGQVRLGIEAVRNRVNREGGIHGRQIDIVYKNDAWDPSRGKTFIENLIQQDKVFALAVSPSSEGLNNASADGVFRDNGVPVVGADGLNNTQFTDPYIWPVAAATTTQVHVIMKEAYGRCEREPKCSGKFAPAIVFGNTYRFGVEGAFAFNGAYCRLTGGQFSENGACGGGKNIPGFEPGGTACKPSSRFCGIAAEKGQYPAEIQTVNDACKAQGDLPKCNFILLLLEPATALAWMGGFPAAGTFSDTERGGCCGMAGAQPLFTSSFAVECRTKCNEMVVWSGYNPPLGVYSNRPQVAQYVRELKAQSSTADEYNQFTLGGYLGMTLLVEALDRVGPDLTREKLRDTLNSMEPLNTGLTSPEGLKWTEQQRYANGSAQGFRIDYTDRFNQWQLASEYIPDDWRGKDNKLP